MKPSSIEMFSRLVDAIYAAALDPSEWSHFSQMIAHATDSAVGGVGFYDVLASKSPAYHYSFGAPAGFFDTIDAMASLNPLLPAAALCVTGDVMVNSQVVPQDEFIKSKFYADCAAPFGLHDAMVLVALRSGPRMSCVAVNRALTKPLYQPADVELMRLLSPHLCRAMTISDALNLQKVRIELLETALDGLVAGVFMLDDNGAVLHMNQSAERMVVNAAIISIKERLFWPVDKASRAAFYRALDGGRTSSHSANLDQPGIAFRSANGTGAGMIAVLMPLDESRCPSGRKGQPSRWAVFVCDPHVAVPMPGEAFAKIYNLTPAELRVTLALAQGLAPDEVADLFGSSLATVRTHIQRAYAKTGVTRHADLIRLMMSSTPPVKSTSETNSGSM